MAVSTNNTGTATAGTTAVPVLTVTGAVTVTAVANRILVAVLGWETKSGDPARNIVSWTLNGDPLELLSIARTEVGTAGGLTSGVAMGYFLAPESGAASLVATLDGNADHMLMAWTTLGDCLLAAPEALASAQGNGSASFLETPITPIVAGGMLLSAFAPNTETTLTASGTGHTSFSAPVIVDGGTGQRLGFGRIIGTTAALVTPRWALSAGNFNRAAMVAAVFAPALPVKVGEPYNSGTQQEGMTLTCHPGRWQYGVQTVTTTWAYVWRKNGAANGTTTQTYVPVALDVGAAIDCVVTATNGAGAGPATATAAIVPIATAADRLTVTDYAAGRVFQRVGTSATIQVSGTYIGAVPNHIQARVLNRLTGATVLDWTTLGAPTIGGGTWTGTLANVPQGGMYYIEARSRDVGNAVLAIGQGGNPWGVGKLGVKAGSSTYDRSFDRPTAEAPNNLVSHFNADLNYAGSGVGNNGGDNAWSLIQGAGDTAHTNAALAYEPGIPIGVYHGARGGTKLYDTTLVVGQRGWSENTFTEYVTLCTRFNALKATTAQTYCLAEYLLIHVGSGDAQNNLIVSQADFETRYRAMLANFRGSTGATNSLGQASLKVFIGGGQRKLAAASPDIQFTWERSGELNVADDANNYFIPGMTDLEVSHDTTHYRALQFAEHGRRSARAWANVTGKTTRPYKGPKPAGTSTYQASTGFLIIDFTIPGGSALTTEDAITTGLTGFRVAQTKDVNDDLTAPFQAITDARIISATQVRLTVNTGLIAPVYWDYCAGANPSPVRRLFDNSGNPP